MRRPVNRSAAAYWAPVPRPRNPIVEPRIPLPRNVLFICSKNRLRSPTAEQVFADWPGVETSSAGLTGDADNPLTAELIEWADLIFVMERSHRIKLSARFKRCLGRAKVVCLDIPDDFAYMDSGLVSLLLERVAPHLPPR